MEVSVPTPDIIKQDVMCAKEESKVPEQQQKEQKNTRKRPTKRQKKKGPATSNQVIPAKRLTLLQKVMHLLCSLLFIIILIGFTHSSFDMFVAAIARRDFARKKCHPPMRTLHCPAKFLWCRSNTGSSSIRSKSF